MEKPKKSDFFVLLKEREDLAYKEFNQKLIPTVPEAQVIGVRVPEIRALAKWLMKERPEACEKFLKDLPHYYLEERHLQAFLIEQFQERERVFEETERFLPYIDNWQTCDLFFPKAFFSEPEALLMRVQKWLKSEACYTVRYGIGVLLRAYLKERFQKEHLVWVQKVVSEEYYVNMMRAWYYSMALVHQYEATLPFLEAQRLDVWTHNKTIQKAVESRQLSKETKAYLRTLKIKQ